MKKLTLLATLTIALTSAPALATPEVDYKTREATGFGVGLLAGAALGGPLGAVIGAGFGAMMGNQSASEKEINQLDDALLLSQNRISQLNHEKQLLASNLNQLQNDYQHLDQQLSTAEQNLTQNHALKDLKLNLQFKSGSAEVSELYQAQLQKVAALIKQNQEVNIALSGFADRHGSDSANQALSAQRAEAVKQVLIANGVNENKIQTQGFGSSQAHIDTPNYQKDFFDRRVEITLQPQPLLTAATND
ncbi:sortase-associated OmpA-like protein PdsO [Catenovulum sp. SM1970]|uniref:sortase-associated OmpA-like protein PdsO n=1 Tax=Marinifaba aquimaris TaxID=2741323 RepID=UPI0015747AA8|nr:sortase-associated OmpA-like protein PdsO [Marinifaba aquimaris]NTS76691.1 sortase-associated OmpA-like protein PdsO [Marinifaba aquimaris]